MKTYTHITSEFVDALRSANPEVPVCVILIGSVARGTATLQSDLDLLVLSSSHIRVPRTDPQLHVQFVNEVSFREKLEAGDDFAASCIRFGVPVIPSETWMVLCSSPEANVWPDWRKKVDHAMRRLLLAATLLDTDDVDASVEEMLHAASHTARAILLKDHIFPLSRPELLQQLRGIGHQHLAERLNELMYKNLTERELRRAQLYVKKLLLHLDRQAYRNCIATHRQAKLAKLKQSISISI